jgi:hypothetical protein
MKDYKGYTVCEDGTIIGKFGKKLKPRKRGDYITVRIANGDGKKGNESWHRIVAECFIPKIEGKDFVNHINGNKYDNRASNLEWVNRSENQLHAYKLGLQVPKKKFKL